MDDINTEKNRIFDKVISIQDTQKICGTFRALNGNVDIRFYTGFVQRTDRRATCNDDGLLLMLSDKLDTLIQ